ncbi:MAG: OmpA family protein [Cytophagaceae bacterium]|jgi:outer membrane protein OmpA-like peptidoglycan-associated protein|nr:OmpA family protein [Cytophagaceae bacterium]
MKSILFLLGLCLCCCAYAQDSTSISNKKKIDELRARLDKLTAKDIPAPVSNEALLAENKKLKDSIQVLWNMLNAHPEIKKYSNHLSSLSSCDCIRVFYELGKYTTDYTSYSDLDTVASALGKNPRFLLKIVGHSDKIGSEGTNHILSKHRAEDLKKYFIQKFGIDASRISIEGHGSAEHIKEIKDPALFYLDRRTEVYLLKI